jgi:elongation factor Ts
MYKVKISQIKELRKNTGAGMIDCKMALQESLGDLEKAIGILRKKGKRKERYHQVTNEGVVTAKVNSEHNLGIIIALNSETDFVSRNEYFVKLSTKIVEKSFLVKTKEELLNSFYSENFTFQEKIVEQSGFFGEKIVLSHFQKVQASFVNSYVHTGNRIAALVGFSHALPGIKEVSKNIAMQIASMNPSNDGKLINFFTLLNQSYILDRKIKVREYLKSFDTHLKIVDFIRVSL